MYHPHGYEIAAAFSHVEMEGHMDNEPVSAGAFTNIFRITAIFIGIYGLGFFLTPKMSMAETNCAKGRRESVPAELREKGCEAPAFIFMLWY
jgi:hypothetical protein